MNSQGSAQNELNTYLDSVEGKMTQLQNSLQQLATVTIDSEWLKDLIELGTSAVEVVTQLVDAFGGLSGILGAGIGGFLQFTGNGLFRKNGMGDWELGHIFKDMKTRFDSTNGGFFKSLKNALFNTQPKEDAIKWLNSKIAENKNATTVGQLFGWDGVRDVRQTRLSNAKDEAQEIIASIAERGGKTMKIDDLIKSVNGQSTFKGIAGSFIKDIGLTAISGLATGAISMAITAAIGKGIEGINYLAHYRENKINEGLAAQGEARKAREEMTAVNEVGENARKRYNELRSGVYMRGNQIKNLSLSTEDYEEFLAINQQLADTFPSLKTGVTDSGQSLVDLGKNAQQATDKLNELIEAQNKIKANEIEKQMPDIVKGIVEGNKNYDDEIASAEKQIAQVQEIQNKIAEINSTGSKVWDAPTNSGARSALENVLNSLGVDYGYYNHGNQGEKITFKLTQDDLNQLSSSMDGYQNILDGYIEKAQDTIKSTNVQKSANWATGFVPNLISTLEADPNFLHLGEDLTDSILSQLYNIDYDTLYEQLGSNSDSFDDDIKNRILAPIEQAVSNGDVSKEALSKIFNFEFDDATNKEMRDQINGVLNTIFPGGEGTENYEIKQTILVGLEYKYKDENGDYHWNATDTRAAIFERLGGEVTQDANGKNVYKQGKSKISWDDIQSLTQKEQRIAQTAMNNQNFNFVGNTIEALREYLNQLSQIKEEAGTGTLKELFNNEQFQTDTSGFETNISTLSSALDNFRESGELTAEQLTDLYKDIPKLAEFGDALTMEDVGDELWKNVSGYVDKFREFMDELSPEQAKLAENFLKSYTDQFANIPVSVEGAKNALRDFFVTTEAIDSESASRRGSEEARYRDIVSSLEGKYDNDVIWSAVLSVAADIDPAETTTEAFIAMVESQIAKMKIDADTSLAEAKIEKLKAGQSLAEQRIENKRNRGETITDEDYAPIYESIDGQREQIKNQQIEALGKRIKNLLYARNSAKGSATEQAYLKNAEDAVTEYLNLQADLEELDSTYMQTKQEQAQIDYNNYKNQLSQAESDGKKIAQERSDIEAKGQTISHNIAEQQANNYLAQIGIQQDIYDEAMSLANTFSNPENKELYNPGLATEMITAAIDAAEAISGLQKYTSPMYNEAESHLNVLQNQMTDIQDQASAINDEITVNQAKGIKANEKEYKNLATLSRQQAKNLSDQNRALRNQLPALRNNKQEYQDTLNQIRQNESSMAQALADAYGYDDQARNLLLTQAQDLSSAIQSAFSEMATPTGITPDTIKAISTAFSDLGSSADLADVFYNTTDGVKANVVELQRLAQQEYELSNSNLTQKINDTTAAINRMENASGDINTAGISKLKQDLADLQQQQSQVFAAYQQLMEQFSQHGQIALADQTVNQGSNYDKAMNYLKEAKEMWDKGLIGTDDYKTRAAYFDEWGLSDPTRFKKNYDKFSKYMTDDIQGVHKFMMDLQSAGMATLETYEDGTQGLVMNFTDLAKAAHQFGAGEEWFRDMFGKAEEYGGMGAFVSSMEDAQLQTQKWTNELTNAQLKYAEMKREGASADDLALQQDVIDQYQGQLNAVQTATQNFQRGQAQEYVSNLKNLKSNIADLKSYYDDAMERGDEASANRFLREAQDLANDYGIKVNADFEVDEASYNAAMKDLEGKIGSWESPLGAEAFGIDRNTAEFSAFEAGKTKVQNAKDAVMEYADALKGISYDELKQIKLGDGDYNVKGLEAAEDALEGIAKAAGLSSAQAEQLVPILAALGVIDFAGAINSMNQFSDSTTVATDKVEALFKGTKYEGATQFDAATMSVDELQNKLAEIDQMKAQINVDEEGGQEALAQLEQLEAKTQQEYNVRVAIEQYLEDGGSLEELQQSMNDGTLSTTLNIDTSDVETAEAMIDSLDGKEISTPVRLDEGSLQGINEAIRAAINGEEYTKEVKLEATGQDEIKAEATKTETKHVNVVYNVIQKARDFVGGVVGAVSNFFGGRSSQTASASLDTSAATAALNALKAQASNIPVTLNIDGAVGQIDSLKSRIDEIRGSDPIQITAENDDALSKIDEVVDKAEGAEPKITIAGDNSEAISSANQAVAYANKGVGKIRITADSSGAISSAKSAVAYASKGTAKIKIDGDTSQAITAANDAVAKIRRMIANISINAHVSATVTGTVVKPSASASSSAAHKPGGKVNKPTNTERYSGTLTSIGYGHAKGTVDEDKDNVVKESGTAYNMLNYKEIKGFAKGDIAIDKDQESLINELGTESIIYRM